MKKNINKILNEVLKKIKPLEKETENIKKVLEKSLNELKKNFKNLKIDAEVFVGGSFAKNTIIRKKYYDIDVFVRFPKKYGKKDISILTENALKGLNASVIHGSRNYFRIKNGNVFVEIIPVIKIKKPEEAENITDLSYLHVKYIKNKLKSGKVLDEVRIAKAFCYAQQCYGAESYIHGFSGYGLELLVYYYGSFLKFIKEIIKKDKIIIDIEKYFKNKNEILMNLNSSKLQSPIVLIDPSYKQRNVLAALSDETFKKFKNTCKIFLKNPSEKAFEIKEIDFENLEKNAAKRGLDSAMVEARTDRQEGDIAGTKLRKFYEYLCKEIEKYFEIKNKEFYYNGQKSAKYFFAVKKKEKKLVMGPKIDDKENAEKFEKKHKNIFVKSGRVYACENVNLKIKKFLDLWKDKNAKKIRDMSISEIKIVP